VHDHVTAGTVILGLAGFRLLSVSEYGGELEQAIETTATEAFCLSCGALARLHGRRPTWVRDLPVAGRPTVLVWVKRIWRCVTERCSRQTWTETTEAIRPRMSLTERARAEACRRVGEDIDSVAAIATEFGVSWGTVMAAVREYGTPRVDDPSRLAGVVGLGVDEHAWSRAGRNRWTRFATGVVDLTPGRPARLLDVLNARTGKAYGAWIAAQEQMWRDQIRFAALDPFRGYATALATELPDAVRVLDAFHVVKLANDSVDQVRRRVQQQTLGHRGHKHDPLYEIRRLLRRGAEHLTDTQVEKMNTALAVGDPNGEVTIAWHMAQRVRSIYHAPNEEQGRRRARELIEILPTCPISEVARLGRTLRSWRLELLAYFDTGGASNGPTEAINLLIEKTRRVGHGFRNFSNYRLRLLLACGVDWQTPSATPIRGRLPRLAA
jgi:transposase